MILFFIFMNFCLWNRKNFCLLQMCTAKELRCDNYTCLDKENLNTNTTIDDSSIGWDRDVFNHLLCGSLWFSVWRWNERWTKICDLWTKWTLLYKCGVGWDLIAFEFLKPICTGRNIGLNPSFCKNFVTSWLYCAIFVKQL